MPINTDNHDTIAAALDDIDVKTGGTPAERLQARQDIREIAAAIRLDRHGFIRSLDVIEAAFRAGLRAGAAGTPAIGPLAAQAFADFEVSERKRLGLP